MSSIDKIIEEYERRFTLYNTLGNDTADTLNGAYNLGYAQGINQALAVFYQLRALGLLATDYELQRREDDC